MSLLYITDPRDIIVAHFLKRFNCHLSAMALAGRTPHIARCLKDFDEELPPIANPHKRPHHPFHHRASVLQLMGLNGTAKKPIRQVCHGLRRVPQMIDESVIEILILGLNAQCEKEMLPENLGGRGFKPRQTMSTQLAKNALLN